MFPLISHPTVRPRSGLPPLPRSLLQLVIKRANEVEPVVAVVVPHA